MRGEGATCPAYCPASTAPSSNPKAIDYNAWEGALTTNVVLWPKPYTIVMNRDAFDALTSEQQEILREAGREALAPELARSPATRRKRSPRRARGAITLVSASAADLAALRAAVQPVYEELERDPEPGS